MNANRKGEVFTSPYTGETFTSRFAYNDHLTRWPEIAEVNGLNLDGSPKEAAAPQLEDLTIAKLTELATAEGIDLGAATKKADIIAAIEAARNAMQEPAAGEHTEGAEGEAGGEGADGAPPTDGDPQEE